ncbi:MAG: BolA family transcriptional regulator [Thiotrichales bacterium]|nr:MAG: BolA family transcriptional regulator [Thiotrichales bacterium]
MQVNKQRIEKMRVLLNAALLPDTLNIIDESHKHVGHAGAKSGAGHFKIIISAKSLLGKPKLQVHRLIYKALASMMPKDIHALSILNSTD